MTGNTHWTTLLQCMSLTAALTRWVKSALPLPVLYLCGDKRGLSPSDAKLAPCMSTTFTLTEKEK